METTCYVSSLSRTYSAYYFTGPESNIQRPSLDYEKCLSDSLDGAGETLPHVNILKNTEKQWGLIRPGADHVNAQRRVKPGRWIAQG